jgi:hypothetical protein
MGIRETPGSVEVVGFTLSPEGQEFIKLGIVSLDTDPETQCGLRGLPLKEGHGKPLLEPVDHCSTLYCVQQERIFDIHRVSD